MDQLTHYREIVRRIILDYANYKPSHGQIETEAIIDKERDHYKVVHVGWDRLRRVYGSVIHLDIINGKIWVQYDGTTSPVVEELEAAGVPRCDIVLGFHPPDVRKHTAYALG
jgi:hypothetical protein